MLQIEVLIRIFFCYFYTKTYLIVDSHWDCLTELIPVKMHKICFGVKEIIFIFRMLFYLDLYYGWYHINHYHCLGKFSRWQIDDIFLSQKLGFDIVCKFSPMKCQNLFSGKTKENYFSMLSAEKYFSYFSLKLGFDISCKFSPMNCENLLSGKSEKNISICHLQKILPRMQSFNPMCWDIQTWNKPYRSKSDASELFHLPRWIWLILDNLNKPIFVATALASRSDIGITFWRRHWRWLWCQQC